MYVGVEVTFVISMYRQCLPTSCSMSCPGSKPEYTSIRLGFRVARVSGVIHMLACVQ